MKSVIGTKRKTNNKFYYYYYNYEKCDNGLQTSQSKSYSFLAT